MFERERTRLLWLFAADLLQVEHIGSTSVPDLAAKPIIDILAGVRSIERANALLIPLCEFGYIAPPDCNTALSERKWLMRQVGGHRTCHLHLVPLNSQSWRSPLRFREILRAKPEIARKYVALKREAALEAGTDRTLYLQLKSQFIENALVQC